MSDDRAGFVPVNTALVRETLVENLHEQVEKRRGERPSESVLSVLEGGQGVETGNQDEKLDKGLRHSGYYARVVEVEMFEPARATAEWIEELLTDRFDSTGSWSTAIVEVCTELANAEPLEKPRPDDEAARTWQIPGPGGHVRHYASSRAIGEELGRISAIAEVGDPSELKRLWLYGFFVRAFEEALPEGASLESEDPSTAAGD